MPLMCGFVERYNPVVATMRGLLDEEPMHIVGLRHSPETPRSTLSVVFDLLIHEIDLALAYMGGATPSRVCGATATAGRDPIVEVADCILQFSSGAVATLSASRASQRKVRSQLVSTATALYDVDLLRQDLTVYRHRAHEQGVGVGQAAGYRAETVVDIPFVRHTGEPLALQFRALPRPDRGQGRCLRRTQFDPPRPRDRSRHRGVRMSDPTVSYIIPVHNQIADLRRTVRLLVERLGHLPGSEILLVENGSSDGSGPLCLSLAALLDSEDVAVRVTTSAKGLGFAWRRGMAMARGELLVLTAADLPFGFTDLDGYLGMSPRPLLVMGSKTHPESQVETSLRGVRCRPDSACCVPASRRRVDTQGTVLMARSLAGGTAPTAGERRLPHRRRDQSAGQCAMGVTPVEIPVVYTASGRSTVSPLRDSTQMAAGLFALRRRLADDGRTTAGRAARSRRREHDAGPATRTHPHLRAAARAARSRNSSSSVLRSGHLAQGPMVERFEALCTTMAGTAHAIAVTNGTVALDAALHVLDIGPGQEVITSPFTFAATINAILRSGASVRFADIRDDFTIDPASVAALIGPATTALMPVHLYGLPADMQALMSLAAANRLAVVEDAAQAHGADVGGRRAGSFGVGCFSFYATKNVTSGEGGCVTTDDSMLAERLRIARNQGMRGRYDYAMIGQNWRMTDVAAAIAIPQMERLDTINAARRGNAATLTACLPPPLR